MFSDTIVPTISQENFLANSRKKKAEHILFLHAIISCGTTSALLNLVQFTYGVTPKLLKHSKIWLGIEKNPKTFG